MAGDTDESCQKSGHNSKKGLLELFGWITLILPIAFFCMFFGMTNNYLWGLISIFLLITLGFLLSERVNNNKI